MASSEQGHGKLSAAAGEGLTRREALRSAGALALAGGLAGSLAGLAGCGPSAPHSAATGSSNGLGSRPAGRRLPFVMDMVLDNPGQAPLTSAYRDPRRLAEDGYGYQVIADWVPPTAAIPYGAVSPEVFPAGSAQSTWLARAQARIDRQTQAAHAAGIAVLYHTDMILLPIRLVELEASNILSGDGQIDLGRARTRELLRIGIDEVFARFRQLDGLLIRTGEVYLQDLPYHQGSDPITRGPASHIELLELLRQEVCVKRGKAIFYRTWAFDGFTTSPGYYLEVAEHIAPHPRLAFSIKHTAGDFWRTVDFNPTLGIGPHQQVVEVECAREYEGKGAHPNYIAQGVIEGFSELRTRPGPIGLADISERSQIAGMLTWSRGGGWNGPRIVNELWCELNAHVLSQWALNRGNEQEIFSNYAHRLGAGRDLRALRQLALLSAEGVLHGHYSTVHRLGALAWTRDEYLGGSDQDLREDFQAIIAAGQTEQVIGEKLAAAELWQRLVATADSISTGRQTTDDFIRSSTRYGALLYSIIAHAWAVMLLGMQAQRQGRLERAQLQWHLSRYDSAWSAYEALPAAGGQCASLYVPYSFKGPSSQRSDPTADPAHGMRPAVQAVRRMLGV